jgi:hypothetical protein
MQQDIEFLIEHLELDVSICKDMLNYKKFSKPYLEGKIRANEFVLNRLKLVIKPINEGTNGK